MIGWTARDIPVLAGRTALVTGGNIGLGFRSALELARKGAAVTIACRSLDKGEAAAERIRAEIPDARLDTVALDLTEPASIEECAGEIAHRAERLDILLKNAGVVNLAKLRHTRAGHEMHMATNHYCARRSSGKEEAMS